MLNFNNSELANFGKIIFFRKNHNFLVLPTMKLLVLRKDDKYYAVCIDIELTAEGENISEACGNLRKVLGNYISKIVENNKMDMKAVMIKIADDTFSQGDYKSKFMDMYLEIKRQHILNSIAIKSKARLRREIFIYALKNFFTIEPIQFYLNLTEAEANRLQINRFQIKQIKENDIYENLEVKRGKVVCIGRFNFQKTEEFNIEIPKQHFIVIESKRDNGLFIATCINVRIDGYGKNPYVAAQNMLRNVRDFLFQNFTHPKCKDRAWDNLEELSRSDNWLNELSAAYRIAKIRLAKNNGSLYRNFDDIEINENNYLEEQRDELVAKKVELETEIVSLKIIKAYLTYLNEMKVRHLTID
jgi:hypothetical protein